MADTNIEFAADEWYDHPVLSPLSFGSPHPAPDAKLSGLAPLSTTSASSVEFQLMRSGIISAPTTMTHCPSLGPFAAPTYSFPLTVLMAMQKKSHRQTINVREMRVDDIPSVYRLGHRLFQSQEASTFYRTWDAYEVTNNFNQDPHLTLLAESRKGRLLGFALGTTYENESGGWKYGYILWMGVSPRWQGSGVGSDLYREMERRMHDDGVRMTFVDTARSNAGAIKFFKRMGYGRPEAEVWMSKIIQRTRKAKNTINSVHPGRRKRHAGRHRKASLRRRSRK